MINNKRRIQIAALFPLLLCLFALPAFAQEHGRGAILDPEIYNKLPRKAVQLTRNYTNIPPAVSIKNYAPYPGNQKQYGTCVAWASAFAARTISESLAVSRLDRILTTGNVFSPAYLYKSISDDPLCLRGTNISKALDLMKKEGIPRMSAFERSVDFIRVTPAMYRNSQKYTIGGYTTLILNRRTEGAGPIGAAAVKKSLSEGKSVIIGMNTPDSFQNLRGKKVWTPLEDPAVHWGGHAMCVVGYDDAQYGGAFEIQNSWGNDWGEGGYIWLKYSDFTRFVDEAYEIIENPEQFVTAGFSGSVDVVVRGNAEGMPVSFDPAGFYRTSRAYPSGTQFRYIMGNTGSAYVYAFAADESAAAPVLIFPAEGVSPVLNYKENAVAFPGENLWIEMDAVTGTDYLAVLFAKRELDIDGIMSRFAAAPGSFAERIAKAAGPGYLLPGGIRYDQSRMHFTGAASGGSAVLGLLLAIGHVSE